ncbi:hypothetical protein [Salmonella enterica]|uniref:hypothetical protein n=1 Tax=Salmonella enterica TaxID=28901 RepID=UPI0015C65EAF|nr:hypothetical protein [Salmonella enterica]NYA57937.1 hypothetical protein [Salmonella enterica]
MDQLEVQIRLIPVATPPLQQKVDEIAQMLHLMAQFAGTELRKYPRPVIERRYHA